MTRRKSYKPIKRFCKCGSESTRRCDICGTLLCSSCVTDLDGEMACQDCSDMILGKDREFVLSDEDEF